MMLPMRYDTDKWEITRWHTETRYYTIEITQDLFGEWICCRTWGARHSKRGRCLINQAENYDDAIILRDTIAKQRVKRGYKMA